MERILGFFGLLGFAMVFGAAISCWISDSLFPMARITAIVGFFVLLIIVVVGKIWLSLPREDVISWDKNWRKARALLKK